MRARRRWQKGRLPAVLDARRNQVGKAALSGWRDALRPALLRGARLWPFEGTLAELAADGGCVVCETYPADAYGYVGAPFTSRESKRNRAHRASKAGPLLACGERRAVRFTDAAGSAIRDGFGSDAAGEDRFDAMAGLLGMIAVVRGERAEGMSPTMLSARWEGWILGRR